MLSLKLTKVGRKFLYSICGLSGLQRGDKIVEKLLNTRLWKFYLFSFVLVFIIPITIAMLLFYIPVKELLKTESINTSKTISKQLKDAMDFRAAEIYSLSVKMSFNDKIKSFYYKKEPLSNIDMFLVKDISNLLYTYKASNSLISYIAVYFPRSSAVITDEGKYDISYFVDSILGYEGIDKDTVKRIIANEYYRNYYIPMKSISGKSLVNDKYIMPLNGRYVTFIQSIPVGEKNTEALIMIFINEEDIIKLIGEAIPSHKGHLIIMSDSGETIIFNSENTDLKELLARRLKDGNNESILETGKHERFMVSINHSDINDWNYIVLSNVEVMLSKLTDIKNTVITVTLLSCFVGLTLSMLMTRFNYKPWKNLKEIISTINNKEEPNNYEIKNEYLFARSAFLNVINEKETIQMNLCKNKVYARQHILHLLCSGRYVPLDDLNNNGIFLPYKMFSVIIIDINSTSPAGNSVKKLISVIEGMEIEKCQIYVYEEVRNKVCVIFNADTTDNSILVYLREKIKCTIIKNSECMVCIGMGKMYEDIDNMYISYNEANKSFEYLFVNKERDIALNPQNQSNTCMPYIPIELQSQLYNVLKIGDYDSCSRYLDEYFNVMNTEDNVRDEYTHYIYYNLVSIGLRVCREVVPECEELLIRNSEKIFDIKLYENQKELMESIYIIFKRVCSYIDKNKDSHNEELKDKIINYIHKNYKDKNLSLKEMADILDFASPYLSRFMKEQIGMGFGDFVTRVRLETAKEMLAGSAQISEIADNCGYTSTNSFIRMFKRIEGITPGRYKDKIMQYQL